MSIKYINLVWEADFGSPVKKLIMMSLADNANEEGECFPSINYIAKRCGLGRSTVVRSVKDLVEVDKVLERVSGRPGISNKYILKMVSERAYAQSGPMPAECVGVGPERAPNHKENHHKRESIVSQCVEVYGLYPKKVAKPYALRAIKKAIKAHGFEYVKAQTGLFAKVWKGAREFIPYPATFFNKERYNDDPSTWCATNSGGVASLPIKPDYTGPESTAEDEAAYKLANRIT